MYLRALNTTARALYVAGMVIPPDDKGTVLEVGDELGARLLARPSSSQRAGWLKLERTSAPDASTPAVKVQAGGATSAPVVADLSKMSEKDAIAVVNGTKDVATLGAWWQSETRDKVKDAIKARGDAVAAGK